MPGVADNILPGELWRKIFRSATHSSSNDPLTAAICAPFYYSPKRVVDRYESRIDAWTTKRQLVLVSRFWYAIGVEFLYEDIRISPYGAAALIASLNSNGKHVRHLEITTKLLEEDHPDWLTRLLHLCPNIQSLLGLFGEEVSAPPGFSIPTDAANQVDEQQHPLAPALSAIEWIGNGDLESLIKIMHLSSPHPRYVSLARINFPVEFSLRPHIMSQMTHFRFIDYRNLPSTDLSYYANVTHLNISSATMYYRPFGEGSGVLDLLGPQLLSIEIGEGGGLLDLSQLFEMCPNLRALAVEYSISLHTTSVAAALTEVRINLAGTALLAKQSKEIVVWNQLEYLNDIALFPVLKLVAVHGQWPDPVFSLVAAAIMEALHRRGVTVNMQEEVVSSF